MNLLGIIENCARSIDKHLLTEIGCYELISLYHFSKKKLARGHEGLSFRRIIALDFGAKPGKQYIHNLINYYKGI